MLLISIQERFSRDCLSAYVVLQVRVGSHEETFSGLTSIFNVNKIELSPRARTPALPRLGEGDRVDRDVCAATFSEFDISSCHRHLAARNLMSRSP